MTSIPDSSIACARVLLVGWDAAEWRLVQELTDRGLMPNVAGLIARGAAGTLATPQPLLSSALWTTIATGLHPSIHRVLSSAEVPAHHPDLQPARRLPGQPPSIWNIAAAAGLPCHTINFPATHPAQRTNGLCLSNYFPSATDVDLSESVFPPHMAESLTPLRLLPSQIDVASILSFVPEAAKIDRRDDGRLAFLISALAHSATVHSAATWALEQMPWRLAAVCYTGLHQISHGFMAFHPPQRACVDPRDFERYQHVVTAAYRFHDMMLGRLLELAGPQTNVLLVSDHGFQTDHRRPGLTGPAEEAMLAWHRPRALAIAAGPNIPAGHSLQNATLLDIAPTVLGLLGVAVPPALQGSVLFGENKRSEPAPSFAQSADAAVSPVNTDASIEHLLALGYTETEDPHAESARQQIRRGRDFYLAVAYLDAAQPSRAIALLEPLIRDRPRQIEYQVALAHAYAGARRFAECREMAETLSRRFPSDPQALVSAGLLALASRRATVAIEYLRRADAAIDARAGAAAVNSEAVSTALGQAYLRLRLFADARRAFTAGLEVDPEFSEAHSGLSAAALGDGDVASAVSAAERAVTFDPLRAMHYYRLGTALYATGELARARDALETSIARDPHSPVALRKLATICERMGDAPAARAYDRQSHVEAINRRLSARDRPVFGSA